MKWERDFKLQTIMVMMLVLLPVIVQATIFYVDSSRAADTGGGTTWGTAKKYLQSGLALASSGDDVYVAKGTYYPDEGTGQTDNDQASTFQMVDGVDMYGGYSTGGGTRDVDTYTTILSGDLTQNDGPNFTNRTDNSYHVTKGIDNGTIDGFTITAGYGASAGSHGAGMHNDNTSPTVNNCTFRDNSARGTGGGIFQIGGSAIIDSCTFSNNEARQFGGGGLGTQWVSGSSLTITNCIFTKNRTIDGTNGMAGGAALNITSTVTNCTFSGNRAAVQGGAVRTTDDGNTFTCCTFSSDTANNYGGAVDIASGSTNNSFTNCVFKDNIAITNWAGGFHDQGASSLMNCTFYNNSAGAGGDGYRKLNCSPTITNSIFWGSDNQLLAGGTGTLTVTYSDVQQASGTYTGTDNINSDPLFVSSSDLHLQDTSPCIRNGTATGAPSDDIEGTTRENPPDMGAYENTTSTAIFVDSTASGVNNGASWSNAYNYLQDGLTYASSGNDIHVAQGTYYPDEGDGQTNNDRNSTFQMVDGVDMVGGYPTGGGTRDVDTYTTILSGDLTQNDAPNFTNRGDNSYHVTQGIDNAIINGFTIKGGYCDTGSGGGMFNDLTGPTVKNCTFTDNWAWYYGGGVYQKGGHATYDSCIFSNNKVEAFTGGGLGSESGGSSSLSLTNCIFSNNTAGNNGGGVAFYISSSTVINCTFSGNTSGYCGGGALCVGSTTFSCCTFSDNTAAASGGGVHGGSFFTNCLFSGNTASQWGGGMYTDNCSPTVTNCTFYDNSATLAHDALSGFNSSTTFKNCICWGSDDQIGHGGSGAFTITYSDIQQASGTYTGTGNINSDPLFVSGSDLHLQDTSPCINAGTSTGAPTDDRDGDTRPMPAGSNPDMGAYEEQLTISDYENVTTPGTYNFNESGEGGNGRDVDINFTSLTGSDSVNVRQKQEAPSDAPCSDVCGFYWNITEGDDITSFTANLTFHYTDPDVTGYTESSDYLGIGKFNVSTNTWIWLGGTVNSGANTVTVDGVTSFSTFALFRRIFGDCTNDGYVDAADLQRLGDCWHETNTGEFDPGCDARFFNFNKNTDAGDQIIDAGDLQVFGDCWHNGTEP